MKRGADYGFICDTRSFVNFFLWLKFVYIYLYTNMNILFGDAFWFGQNYRQINSCLFVYRMRYQFWQISNIFGK